VSIAPNVREISRPPPVTGLLRRLNYGLSSLTLDYIF